MISKKPHRIPQLKHANQSQLTGNVCYLPRLSSNGDSHFHYLGYRRAPVLPYYCHLRISHSVGILLQLKYSPESTLEMNPCSVFRIYFCVLVCIKASVKQRENAVVHLCSHTCASLACRSHGPCNQTTG